MPIASNSDNIRFNGTGRMYVAAVGAAGVGFEVGEIDGLAESVSSSADKIKSNRTAARATLKEVPKEREMTLKFGMREQALRNLELYLSANTASASAQTAGYLEDSAITMTSGEYANVGKLDCFLTKVSHGTVTSGPFTMGDTVTGGTSSATGKVGWVGSGFLELINVSGTFVAGETITSSAKSATVSAVEVIEDMIVCDAASATARYVQGTDYRLDVAYGYIMKLPSPGTIGATAYVSCDYGALDIRTVHALSASAIEKKITFVSDQDDIGPRMRITYWKVNLLMDGDRQQIGEGEAPMKMTGTVLVDSTQPTGQQISKTEMIGVTA